MVTENLEKWAKEQGRRVFELDGFGAEKKILMGMALAFEEAAVQAVVTLDGELESYCLKRAEQIRKAALDVREVG
jgi:hypothetical protein